MNAAQNLDPYAEPLFHSADQAVKFAVTRVGSAGRPLMNRMSDKSMPDSGLGGLDGAAQAGMILDILQPIGRLGLAAIIASSAPMSFPCQCKRLCCSGKTFNPTFNGAVNTIVDALRFYGVGDETIVAVSVSDEVYTREVSKITDNFGKEQLEREPDRVDELGNVIKGAIVGGDWVPAKLPEGATRIHVDAGLRLGLVLKVYGQHERLNTLADRHGKHVNTVSKYHKAALRWLKGETRDGVKVQGIEDKAWAQADQMLRARGLVGDV